MAAPNGGRKLVRLKRSQLREDPNQPRKDFPLNAIMALAENIRQVGLQVPLIVCPLSPEEAKAAVDRIVEEELFAIIDGHRRYRASGIAAIEELDAVVLAKRPEPDELLAVQLSLGSMGERLNAVDLAEGLQRLRLMRKTSDAETAAFVGISTAQFSKLLKVNAGLDPRVKEDVRSGLIGFSYAAALARVQDVPTQIDLAEKVKAKLLNRDALEYEVHKLRVANPKRPKPFTVKEGHALLQMPGDWGWEQINSWLLKLGDAVRKGMRNNLPPTSLPSLL